MGHCQIGSNSTCLPWYSASSCAQMAFIASTRSRMLPWRVAGSVPWLSISCLFQPAPTPNTKRPPQRFCSDAICLASTIGSCSITRQTLVPTISFSVAAAAKASATNGSWVRR